ncbi:MAG: hypothetical protein COY40_03380 [Alphaproteobacteria bacterium CG_4_10_14_0_8_um_filter_53_9]|nr:MAG: hypothetical protein COY40_03380 [Alphaproteobacteria bacterium CG_4_10_14_0_8_um_filter_53_9]
MNPLLLWQQTLAAPFQAQAAYFQTVSTIMQSRIKAVTQWQQNVPAHMQQLASCTTWQQAHKALTQWNIETVSAANQLNLSTHSARMRLLQHLKSLTSPTATALSQTCESLVKTASSSTAQAAPSTSKAPASSTSTAPKASPPSSTTTATASAASTTTSSSTTSSTEKTTQASSTSSPQKEDPQPALQLVEGTVSSTTNPLRQTISPTGASAARSAASSSARRSVVARRSTSKR